MVQTAEAIAIAFIFTEYTGAASNIALSFAYDGSQVYATVPTNSHDVYVFNNNTGLWYDIRAADGSLYPHDKY